MELESVPGDTREESELLFSESNCRYLVEVTPENLDEFLACFDGLPVAQVGETGETDVLEVTGRDGAVVLSESLAELKSAWKDPLIFDVV